MSLCSVLEQGTSSLLLSTGSTIKHKAKQKIYMYRCFSCRCTPRLGKRELICLLVFTCNYVVSVRRGFLFLWVVGMGMGLILLWHSLSLPYNHFLYYSALSSNLQNSRMCRVNKISLPLFEPIPTLTTRNVMIMKYDI